MKPKFYFYRFIYIFLGFHAITYLCWSFVEFSLKIPIIETFKTSESRSRYLIYIFVILCSGAPFYCPFEKNKL